MTHPTRTRISKSTTYEYEDSNGTGLIRFDHALYFRCSVCYYEESYPIMSIFRREAIEIDDTYYFVCTSRNPHCKEKFLLTPLAYVDV